MRHEKSHFVVFLALNSPGPYHRYFKLWQREPGFLPRLGQFSRPLQTWSLKRRSIPLRFISLSANASSISHTS